MISGAAGLGLWGNLAIGAQNSEDIFLSEGIFLARLNSESFPRLAQIYGDVAGFRGAEETELRKKKSSG